MTIQGNWSKSNDYIEILCVEEGSVDIEKLKNVGVPEENIIVYRKGGESPYLLRIKKENN